MPALPAKMSGAGAEAVSGFRPGMLLRIDEAASDGSRDDGQPSVLDARLRLEMTQQLLDDHHDRVYRYACLLSSCKTAAEDITQEVFVRAMANVHQLRSMDTAGGWLMAITRNEVARWFGKWGLSQKLDVDPAIALGDNHGESEFEDHEWVHRAVERLPFDFRQVVLMFYFEQKSYQEIAAELNLPMGTVMSRLNRARGHLKTSLIALSEPVHSRSDWESTIGKDSPK